MQAATEGRESDGGAPAKKAENTRPQQAGEAGTTRFGMEDGDNTDIPATGTSPDRQSEFAPKREQGQGKA